MILISITYRFILKNILYHHFQSNSNNKKLLKKSLIEELILVNKLNNDDLHTFDANVEKNNVLCMKSTQVIN